MRILGGDVFEEVAETDVIDASDQFARTGKIGKAGRFNYFEQIVCSEISANFAGL